MNKCLLPLIFGGFLWLGSVSVGMCEAIRIAVVGDAALSPLVALTESELSKAPDLAVLNREDLGAAGREAETSAIFASPEPARLQLLPADGLVVLRSLGKSGVLARLVAIKPAVVLHEFLLPGEADPSAQAEAVRKGFSGWLPKVAMAREDTLEGLSLPGLRSEVDAPGARELERRVNLLLASRLAASSGVVVLERWRLDDAVFEKSISPAEPTPFWQGRALLDGSVRNRDGLVRVSLRIRSSHGEETTISDQDTPENLPGLIERLAGKVVRRPLPSGGWNLQKEASHYAGLAEWCLDNRLYDDGTQAVETAIALGDVSRATQVLRIKAYAMKAYPDDLRVANTNYLRSVLDLSRESLRERLEACARAADLTCGYIEASHDFSEGKWDLKNPADLGPPVVNNCLRALKAAFENGNPEDYAAPLTEARHAVRKLITLLTAYLPGKSESGAHYLLRYKIRYASFWHETPVATLEFYQRVLEAPTEDGVRDELFSTVRTPRLDEGGTPVFVSALARPGAPWLVEWKGESATQLQAAWRKFVQDYGNSPDPVARADALKFEYFSTHSNEGRDKVLAKIVKLLQENADTIQGPKGAAFVDGFGRSYQWARQRPDKNAAQLGKILSLYQTLLSRQVPLPPIWLFDLANLPDQTQPETEALQGLLAALDDHAQWQEKNTPHDGTLTRALARAKQNIIRMRPELAGAAQEQAGTFTVRKLWLERDRAADAGAGRNLSFSARSVMIFQNQIWFLAEKPAPRVICLDPESLQVKGSIAIPDELISREKNPRPPPSFLMVSEKWLTVAHRGQVFIGSRVDDQWRALVIPPSSYKPFLVEGVLYLLYDADRGDQLRMTNAARTSSAGSGLVRVALPQGTPDDLISSRRIPPQNELDGKPLGRPTELWQGPDGLTMATDASEEPRFRVYASASLSDWRTVYSHPGFCRTKATSAGVVVGHALNRKTFAGLSLMNAKGIKTLLANPEREDAPPTPAIWNFPDEFKTAPEGHWAEISPVMRNGDLILCRTIQEDSGATESLCLYYFARDKRDAVKIPLSFDTATVSDPAQARVIARPSMNFQSLASTDHGLIICNPAGFWILPWKDIDKHRAKIGIEAARHPSFGLQFKFAGH